MPTQREETLSRLLSEIRHSPDFPAMTGTISLINKFKTAEVSSVSEFANIILKDYALTSRLLKIVNSVGYSQFGEVTTISRAIILLGFENVKNLALTLMLFEQFQKRDSGSGLMDTLMQSYYSGILAQNIAGETLIADREEAFICSMLHAFGKIMVAFYLPSKLDDIRSCMAERKESEGAAAITVLGVSYEEIGMTVAKEWNLPQKIVMSMHNLRGSEITKSPNEQERLNSIATLSNDIAVILASNGEKSDKDEKIKKLVQSYSAHYKNLGEKITAIVDNSVQDLVDFSSTLKVDIKTVPFSSQLFAWSQNISTADGIDAAFPVSDGLDTIDSLFKEENVENSEAIFTNGIQDINHSIVSSFSLNDVVRIAIETIYRGMGASCVLFMVKDTKLPVMSIRFGFGNDIEGLKSWFKVEVGNKTDIFNIAINKQADYVVKDIGAPEIMRMLPEWYKGKVSQSAFIIILPIIINAKPLGIFYIEGDKNNFKNVTKGMLNYLKILRDQTVLAVKQKQGY
ncbi:MAG: HDOD domain-containing protein [Nitrospirae bacterium]|nr:MAG: HDOD domain-containing protein [Nitrospirota bacterium]